MMNHCKIHNYYYHYRCTYCAFLEFKRNALARSCEHGFLKGYCKRCEQLLEKQTYMKMAVKFEVMGNSST